MALEGMRRIQTEQIAEEQRRLTPDPISGKPMGMGESEKTLQEIRENQHEQGLFIQFVHQKDKRPGKALSQSKAVVEKWVKGNPPPTEKQMELLEAWRKEFNAVRAECMRVRETMDGEYIKNIARMNPKIQQIVGQVGAEKAARLIAAQLEDTSIMDRPIFDRLLRSMKAEYGVRNSEYAKSVEQQGLERLARYGISGTEFENAIRESANMTYGVSDKTQRALEDLAKRNLGKFKNVINFATFGGVQKFRTWKLKRNVEEQRALLRQCDTHFVDAGWTLRTLLTPQLYEAVQKAVLEGGDPQKTPETNVSTIEHLRTAKEKHSLKSVQDRFAVHMKAETRRLKKSVGRMNAAEKKTMKDSFVDKEIDEQKELKPKGWLMTILSALFMSRAEIKKEIDKICP